MNFAIVYLDNLDLVQFETRDQYNVAAHAANMMSRPYLSMGRKLRHGRKVWQTRAVHYFDPQRRHLVAAFSRS